MKSNPSTIIQKLQEREKNIALRQLVSPNNLIDFTSNDYLGFAKNEAIFYQTHHLLLDRKIIQNGATGSRLLSGNHELYEEAESRIAQFHKATTALIFNSGYDANVGFFGAVPQKRDVILYDELCHASIREGMQLSNAKSYKFQHNDCEDLERLILKFQPTANSELPTAIYIVTESVFSMDGDCPDLEEVANISEKYGCYLVVDEAHSLGVFGSNGAGLIQMLGLENHVFARIMTFGKGLGCHGAAILGSQELKNYLINFARSFIYTTGLSPHAVATIFIAYQHLEMEKSTLEKLRENVIHFNQEKTLLGLKPLFVRSKSAIQSAIIPGNEKSKNIASQLQKNGFNVKAILSPTVPLGQERLRFCIHSWNTKEEISAVLRLFSTLFFSS